MWRARLNGAVSDLRAGGMGFDVFKYINVIEQVSLFKQLHFCFYCMSCIHIFPCVCACVHLCVIIGIDCVYGFCVCLCVRACVRAYGRTDDRTSLTYFLLDLFPKDMVWPKLGFQ